MSVKIEVLPNDDLCYIVLWVGPIIRVSNGGLVLKVQMVSAKEGTLEYRPFMLKYTTSHETIHIPIKYIPLIKIGSVFKNQIRIKKNIFSSYEVSLENPVEFNPQKIRERLSNGVEGEEYYKEHYKLNFNIFSPYPNSNYCVAPKGMFQISGNKVPDEILIPCYEILRFYYLRSDNITEAIFDGAIFNEWTKIYDEGKSALLEAHEKKGFAAIVINRKMLFSDGPIIYRMTSSEVARKEITRFYRGFVTSIMNKYKTGGIRCRIPFDKNIKLNVSGIWMEYPDPNGKKTNFVVTQINSHNNQWDFEHLKIYKDVCIKDEDDISDPIGVRKIIRAIDTGGDFYIGPDYIKTKKNHIIDDDEKESNYDNISSQAGYVEVSDNVEVQTIDYYLGADVPFHLINTIETSGGILNKRIVTLKRDDEEVLDKSLENFIQALEKCKKNGGRDQIQINYCVVEKDKNEKITNFPLDFFKETPPFSDTYKWLHCVYNKSNWQVRRRAVLAEIIINTKTYCYFLKFRPSYRLTEIAIQFIKTKNNKALDANELKDLLIDFANGCGKLKENCASAKKVDLKVGRIADSQKYDEYGDKLYKKIKSVVSIEPD